MYLWRSIVVWTFIRVNSPRGFAYLFREASINRLGHSFMHGSYIVP